MLIFIEGPDGSGKSTLVKALSKTYSTATICKKTDNIAFWNAIYNISDRATLIFDRSPITELVYRACDNGPASYGLNEVTYWLRHSKIVFCNTPTAYDDAMSRGETNITNQWDHISLTNAYKLFITMLKKAGYQVMDYNWQEQTLDDVIKFIEGGNEDDVR